MNPFSRILAALALLLATGSALSEGLRCDGNLVSPGDRMFEVRAHCGEPDIHVVKSALHTGYPGYIAHEEQWQYNLGPRRQLRFLDFVDKELRRITTGGSGFTAPANHCDPNRLETGISRLELLGRCGEPDRTAERATRRHFRAPPGGLVYREGVPATDWIYRFEGQHFARVVTLIDGWVVRVNKRDKKD